MEGIEASRYIGTDGGSEGLKAIQDSNTDCVAIGTTLCNKFFVWVEEDGHTPLKRLVLFEIQRTVLYMYVPSLVFFLFTSFLFLHLVKVSC